MKKPNRSTCLTLPTKNKAPRTAWISASINPVHVGWYEVTGPDTFYGSDEHNVAMRYWNGFEWLWLSIFENDLVYAGVGHNDRWRGLVKRPKE